jgi:diacylglycerol kinase family enzyme
MASGGVRRIEAVVNCESGSVGAAAPGELAAILAEHGLTANIRAPRSADLVADLRAAVDAAPDLLIVLAGDGTARAAAQLAGPKGPVIAPLAGGTMNMLPHAVYGVRPWQAALRLALEHGEAVSLDGGEADGRVFLVAGILGSPALWAPAREAARHGQPKLAWLRARRAWRRAFTGRLRYALDGAPRRKTEALVFMCPLTSRALPDDAGALEAAALDVAGAADVFRLGVHAVTGDWRDAPSVAVQRCQAAEVWSAHHIPAILDGEAVSLGQRARLRFRPAVARVLALPKDARTLP